MQHTNSEIHRNIESKAWAHYGNLDKDLAKWIHSLGDGNVNVQCIDIKSEGNLFAKSQPETRLTFKGPDWFTERQFNDCADFVSYAERSVSRSLAVGYHTPGKLIVDTAELGTLFSNFVSPRNNGRHP